MNSKSINNIFITIVESLLLEKPDNPIAFMIDHLRQKYPDQAGAVGQGTSSRISTNLTGVQEDEEESDLSSDEEDEDDFVDLPDLPVAKAKPRNRRVSVSAEAGGFEKAKKNFVAQKFDKSESDVEHIMEMLGQSFLFSSLDVDQKKVVVDAMFPKEYSDGDVIIQQGDAGDNFYILDDGQCDVYVVKDGADTKVLEYSKGDGFGELALMYNAPRAATVKAVGSVRLWGLDRVTFKVTLTSATVEKRTKYKGFLESVPILKTLTENERLTIADSLKPVSFQAGSTICKQGDRGNSFYILEGGNVVCTQQSASSPDPIEVANLGPGAYFGEIALLTSKPRQATVTATVDSKLLCLDRQVFKRVLGPLTDVLKREMGTYNSFMSQQV